MPLWQFQQCPCQFSQVLPLYVCFHQISLLTSLSSVRPPTFTAPLQSQPSLTMIIYWFVYSFSFLFFFFFFFHPIPSKQLKLQDCRSSRLFSLSILWEESLLGCYLFYVWWIFPASPFKWILTMKNTHAYKFSHKLHSCTALEISYCFTYFTISHKWIIQLTLLLNTSISILRNPTKMLQMYTKSQNWLYGQYTSQHVSHAATAPCCLAIKQEEQLILKINDYASWGTLLGIDMLKSWQEPSESNS